MSSSSELMNEFLNDCTLRPVCDNNELVSSSVVLSSDGKWKTSSFYLDSSGRSSISLPLQLQFRTAAELNKFIEYKCFDPYPSNYNTTTNDSNTADSTNDTAAAAAATTAAATAATTTTKDSINTNNNIIRSIGIEAKVTLTFGTGTARTATVEGVTILSSRIGTNENDNHSIYFMTEIIIRVAKGYSSSSGDVNATTTTTTTDNNNSMENSNNNALKNASSTMVSLENENSGVKTNLEINAVYTERTRSIVSTVSAIEALKSFNKIYDFNSTSSPSASTSATTEENSTAAKTANNAPNSNDHHWNVMETRLHNPIALHVTLTHALSISVTSIDGTRMGQTYLSLTMAHSNTHQLPVTITSIALHPGHARYHKHNNNLQQQDNNNEKGSDPHTSTNSKSNTKAATTADMSKSVKWGYAPKSEPSIPLTLEPNDVYTTIIIVDASEDETYRLCTCPLSITALIGDGKKKNTNQPNSNNIIRRYYVVAAVEAMWSTSPAGNEHADSFRIEMSIAPSSNNTSTTDGDDDNNIMENTNADNNMVPNYCHVGSPFTVLLDIYNLSSDARQLMLLIDNNVTAPVTSNIVSSNSSVNSGTSIASTKRSKSLVVSEKGGYKFGVWGLSSRSSSSSSSMNVMNRDTPEEKDPDLLAVDVALLLGEVKGLSSTKAKLRLVPLREGTIRLPNFKLVDSRSGQRYNCYHRLHAVVVPAATATEAISVGAM